MYSCPGFLLRFLYMKTFHSPSTKSKNLLKSSKNFVILFQN
jgi:hypothetical protein